MVSYMQYVGQSVTIYNILARGWTKDLPKTYPDLMKVAQIGTRAIKMRYGTEYEYGTSPSILCKLHKNQLRVRKN